MDLSGIVVVLVRPEGPQNVGSVARLCGNFGASLRLVDPRCDPGCRDALKMAHPCEEPLLQAPRLPDLPAALADVALAVATSGKLSGAIDAPALDVARARLLLPAPGERTAFVFGNERTGLAKDEAAHCARLLRLPTPGPVDSLNLASAVAVTLTLCASGAQAAQSSSSSSSSGTLEHRASAGARAALRQAWLHALAGAGFFRATTAAQFTPRLHELLDKMDVSERDAALLRDMFVRLGPRPDPDAKAAPPAPPSASTEGSTGGSSE
jgi:tRNA/rRNA methyltransferase